MYEENKINYNHIFEAAIAETKTVDRSFARGFAISIDRSARPKLKTKSPCQSSSNYTRGIIGTIQFRFDCCKKL
jgi:hypothetical protein